MAGPELGEEVSSVSGKRAVKPARAIRWQGPINLTEVPSFSRSILVPTLCLSCCGCILSRAKEGVGKYASSPGLLPS